MDEIKDPILREQKGIPTNGLEYSFVNLPKSVIEIVDACIRVVWVMGNYGKTVEPRDIVYNAQQMFINEEIKAKDNFWKEHCAGSLRELVDSHFEANCLRFLKFAPKRSESDETKQLCEKLSDFKEFLNDFAHFKDTAVTGAQNLITPAPVEISEQVFDKICTAFIFHLGNYFKYKNK